MGCIGGGGERRRRRGRGGGASVMEAVRHITSPQCIKGTGPSVTHPVRTGRAGGDGERGRWGEGAEETDGGMGERRRSFCHFFFACLTFPFFWGGKKNLQPLPPPVGDVIQVTHSSRRGGLPPSLPLILSLPLLPLQSADALNA